MSFVVLGPCSKKLSGFFIVAICLVGTAFSADDLPGWYVNLLGGMTTYKSEFVKSNDTSTTSGYELGIFAGNDKNIGSALSTSSNSTDFQYAENEATSQIVSQFEDILIRFAWSGLYFGPVLSKAQMTVKKQDEDTLDFLASGTGFHGGWMITLGQSKKQNQLWIDFKQVNYPNLKDVLQGSSSTVQMGTRTDIFIGGSLALTNSLLNMLIAYQQKSYSLSLTSTSSNEVVTTTFIGFVLKGHL